MQHRGALVVGNGRVGEFSRGRALFDEVEGGHGRDGSDFSHRKTLLRDVSDTPSILPQEGCLIACPAVGWQGYLICVVPGARLGSVSFAADWYILV